MAKTTISNATGSAKAVRTKSGHVVIKNGKSADLDISDLDKTYLESLKAAGLKFGKADAEPKDDPKGK